MTAPQVGDVVDIKIRGAKVVGTHGEDTGFDYGNGATWLDINSPAVTVTRRAPQPQAGEVWKWITGKVVYIAADLDGTLWTVAPDCVAEQIKVEHIDWTGAKKLYPLDAAVGVAAPTLRRLERRRDGHIWTETAPGSDRYTAPGRDDAVRRSELELWFDIVGLDPVPADAEAVR